MRHEEIINQKDGSKIRAIVIFYDNDYSRKSTYIIELYKCEKSKRTYHLAYDNDSYKFRSLSMEDRAKSIHNSIVSILGKEMYNAVLLNAWQQLKRDLL